MKGSWLDATPAGVSGLSVVVGRPPWRPDRSVLSADERARAGRIRDVGSRWRYEAGRSQLRQLVGEATGREPADVRFRAEPSGRLSVLEADDLSIGLSHTTGLTAIAVADVHRPIGIDVEHLGRARLPPDRAWIAPEDPPAEGDPRARLLLWTVKEAVAKAHGGGLAMVRGVRVRPGERVASAGGALWEVLPLDVGPDHVGVVVIPRRSPSPRGRDQWPTRTVRNGPAESDRVPPS